MTSQPNQSEVTFSFGENWERFEEKAGNAAVEAARRDLRDWIGTESIRGSSVLDAGCGSGIHSLAFHLEGARKVVSFDVDEHSVAATRRMRQRAGDPQSWKVLRGSILDSDFVESLDAPFEIVYSWGVLHHTGEMWKAIDRAAGLVDREGLLWIALYAKGPGYERDLRLKQRYNRASAPGKRAMVWLEIAKIMARRAVRLQNPFAWNEPRERGMDVYHDVVDWLGGLPYEVASPDEVEGFLAERGFEMLRLQEAPEGGNHVFLLQRRAG